MPVPVPDEYSFSTISRYDEWQCHEIDVAGISDRQVGANAPCPCRLTDILTRLSRWATLHSRQFHGPWLRMNYRKFGRRDLWDESGSEWL